MTPVSDTVWRHPFCLDPDDNFPIDPLIVHRVGEALAVHIYIDNPRT